MASHSPNQDLNLDSVKGLWSLSPAALAALTHLLSAHDISTLYSTGDQRVRTLMETGGVQSFVLTFDRLIPRLLKWPRIINRFQGLVHLEVDFENTESAAYIKDIDLTTIPKSVESISIARATELFAALPFLGDNNLSELFPNLKHLSLPDTNWSSHPEAFLKFLPSSLRSLHTRFMFQPSDLKFLPASLSNLSITMDPEANNAVEHKADFPKTLETLALRFAPSVQFVNSLPSSLRDLTLSFSWASNHNLDELVLPPHLTSLRLKCPGEIPPNLHQKYPESLTRVGLDEFDWRFPTSFKRTSVDDGVSKSTANTHSDKSNNSELAEDQELPKSTTALDGGRSRLTLSQVELFKSSKSLLYWHGLNTDILEVYGRVCLEQSLPSSLVSLKLNLVPSTTKITFGNDMARDFPTLQVLHIENRDYYGSDIEIGDLPPSLTEVRIVANNYSWDPFTHEKLPHLKNLALYLGARAEGRTINKDFLKQLPHRLNRLSLDAQASDLTLEDLRYLPQELLHVEMLISPQLKEVDFARLSDPLSYLPPYLLTFRDSRRIPKAPTSPFAPLLAKRKTESP